MASNVQSVRPRVRKFGSSRALVVTSVGIPAVIVHFKYKSRPVLTPVKLALALTPDHRHTLMRAGTLSLNFFGRSVGVSV